MWCYRSEGTSPARQCRRSDIRGVSAIRFSPSSHPIASHCIVREHAPNPMQLRSVDAVADRRHSPTRGRMGDGQLSLRRSTLWAAARLDRVLHAQLFGEYSFEPFKRIRLQQGDTSSFGY